MEAKRQRALEIRAEKAAKNVLMAKKAYLTPSGRTRVQVSSVSPTSIVRAGSIATEGSKVQRSLWPPETQDALEFQTEESRSQEAMDGAVIPDTSVVAQGDVIELTPAISALRIDEE